MAIKKKTIEQIAKENKIDISEENAQRVADAYIQPTLDALTTSEQNLAAGTQSSRKALENDYFNQYRTTQYNAQSRGLTGGLASLAENRLRAEMTDANTNLTNAFNQEKAKIDTSRGTALSNAKAYKTDYLNKLLQQVQTLREQDYAQRLDEWYKQQQLALQRAQLAAAYQKNTTDEKLKQLQLRDYGKQIYAAEMGDVYNRYKQLLKEGNVNKAADYLYNTWKNNYGNLGISYQDFASDIQSASNYEYKTDLQKQYTTAANAQRTKSIADTIAGVGLGVLSGLIPGAGVAGTIIPTVAAGAAGGVGGYAVNKGYTSKTPNYSELLKQVNEELETTRKPSWYQ